jgi:hypothetical protein
MFVLKVCLRKSKRLDFLRHTFVTDMRKAGVPEKLIMKITGHSTREMFDRYNTITPDEKDQASVQLVSFRSNPKKEKAVTANNHDSDNQQSAKRHVDQ